jgi:hypothetical protein
MKGQGKSRFCDPKAESGLWSSGMTAISLCRLIYTMDETHVRQLQAEIAELEQRLSEKKRQLGDALCAVSTSVPLSRSYLINPFTPPGRSQSLSPTRPLSFSRLAASQTV